MRFQPINPNKEARSFENAARRIHRKNLNVTQTRGGGRM